MSPTAIEWADEVWNPTLGCSVASPGCDNCYAARVAMRNMSPEHIGLAERVDGVARFNGTVRVLEERFHQPLRWKRPRRVFVDSMSDLFHPHVDALDIVEIFAVMAVAEDHTFQVLTKRPRRMALLLGDPKFEDRVRKAQNVIAPNTAYDERSWPLPNVWLGTSIESDRYSSRADLLRATPAAIRFVSAEPLLGPLPDLHLAGVDWLIVGGESGPRARPMHPRWVRDLRDRATASGTRLFFKQWGEWSPHPPRGNCWTHQVHLDGSLTLRPTYEEVSALVEASADGSIPDDGWYGVTRLGKREAGRELDGRTWDEFPERAA